MRLVAVVILIPLMILSSGGFNLFVHLCHATGERIVSVKGPESCAHDDAQHGHENGMPESCGHCCSVEKIKQASCCEDEHFFIRTVEVAAGSDHESDELGNHEPILLSVRPLTPETLCCIPEGYQYTDFAVPPERQAKYIPVLFGQLRLDCCVS